MKSICLLLFLMSFASVVLPQNNDLTRQPVSIEFTNIPINDAIDLLCKKYTIDYALNPSLEGLSKKVSKNYKEIILRNVLEDLLKETYITYAMVGSQLIFKEKPQPKKKFTISGYVEDTENGERLTGVIIQEEVAKVVVITNAYGFYSITLPEGDTKLKYSYLGYNQESKELNLTGNHEVNIKLTPSTIALKEVTVTDNAFQKHVESTQMSMNELQMKNMKSLPVLIGESDIMKTLQLLPGIQHGTEGSSSIYVRGGNADQNMILLDGAPVYNINHLFGYMSTFNDDAIQSVTVLKGGIPARYGGRLSSVVDVKMKEGNNKKFKAQLAIGTLASRLTLEGPLFNEKTSFLFSARRTYFDLLTRPLLKLYSISMRDEKVDLYYFFQDYNVKVNHTFSSKSHLFLSLYTGTDVLYGDQNFKMDLKEVSEKNVIKWGNITATTRWNYKITDKLFSNVTFIYSQYKIRFSDNSSNKDTNLITRKLYGKYQSGICDYGTKIDFDYFLNTNHTIRFGTQSTLHNFNPGSLTEGSAVENVINSGMDTTINLKSIHFVENEIYIEDEIKISNKLKTNIGLRYSIANVKRQTYQALQPRISLRYLATNNLSVKAAWSVMNQNLSLLTGSSAIGLPIDLWVPATERLDPQHSNIYSLGSLYAFENNIEVSTELYYKTMQNVIDYKDGSSYVFMDQKWEDKLAQGKGIAYGAEFLVEKKTGKTFGWLSYTWAKSKRQFDKISNGNWFPYQYDRRHNLNLVIAHRFSERFEIGATWTISSGRLLTVNNQKFQSYLEPGRYIESFDSRNNFQTPFYHRLDLSLQFTKTKRRGIRTWSLGCYNVYNKKNPTTMYVENNELKQLTSLPIIPSITYSFKFQKNLSVIKANKDKRDDLLLEQLELPKQTSSPGLSQRNITPGSTGKGSRLAGINFNASYSSLPKAGSITTSLTRAKFRVNNFALGSMLDIAYTRYSSSNYYSLGYGILSRYYIGKSNTKPFAQLIPSLPILPQLKCKTSFGIGVAHFISDRVAIEAVLSDYNIFSTNRNLSFKFGFQIYFPHL